MIETTENQERLEQFKNQSDLALIGFVALKWNSVSRVVDAIFSTLDKYPETMNIKSLIVDISNNKKLAIDNKIGPVPTIRVYNQGILLLDLQYLPIPQVLKEKLVILQEQCYSRSS
jgi:hypothetical protein